MPSSSRSVTCGALAPPPLNRARARDSSYAQEAYLLRRRPLRGPRWHAASDARSPAMWNGI
eukprot:4927957-Pleurochrysis_carterae.AAC.2